MSHYNPYQVYIDSGVKWIGQIPEHWQVKQVKYLTSHVGSGKTPTGGAEVYQESGILFLRSQNVYESGLRLGDVAFISEEIDEDMKGSRVEPGDVLLNITGASIGRSCLVPDAFERANVNQHVCVIRTKQPLIARWISLCLPSQAIQAQIDFYQNGAGREGLNFEQIGKMLVALPPLSDIAEISNRLDGETARIDALVEKKTRFIALLREKRQALITHAATKGLDSKVPMKDSGVEWLGEVPAHWTVRPLKFCLDFQEGPGIMAVDFREDGIPLLRVSGVQGGYVTLDGCNFLDPVKVAKQWSHFRLSEGDLLISGSASMGNVTEVGQEAAGAIAYTGLIRLREKYGVLKRDFIRWAMESSLFSTQVDLFKAGSTIQHFGPTHLSQMFLVVPSPTEQAEISSYLASATTRLDSIVRKTERSIELLKERRSALITAAVTGQIDLRGTIAAPSQKELRETA